MSKKTLVFCDICDEQIEDDQVVIKGNNRNTWKPIGGEMVLTPRGDRFHPGNSGAMVRINARFYCGVNPGEVEEFHFHKNCIEREVFTRLSQFVFQGQPEPHKVELPKIHRVVMKGDMYDRMLEIEDVFVTPNGFEVVVTGRPTEAKDKITCYETVLTALAAYTDKGASAHLRETGKWSAFDEPSAACEARTALERFK